jgi:hypothetical protein
MRRSSAASAESCARSKPCLFALSGLALRVVAMRAGIGVHPSSRAQVAGRLHLSKSRVRHVERRALRRLLAANHATGCAQGGAANRANGTVLLATFLEPILPDGSASLGEGSLPAGRTVLAEGAQKSGSRSARTSGEGGGREVYRAQGGVPEPTPFGSIRAGSRSVLSIAVLALLVLAGIALIARELSRATR